VVPLVSKEGNPKHLGMRFNHLNSNGNTGTLSHPSYISLEENAVQQGISEAFLNTVLVHKSRTKKCPLSISPRHLSLSLQKTPDYSIGKGMMVPGSLPGSYTVHRDINTSLEWASTCIDGRRSLAHRNPHTGFHLRMFSI